MKLTKTQQMLLLGAGVVTVIGIAVYLMMTRQPPAPPPTGEVGQLRVETQPPTDVDMYVDGEFVSSWGVDWVKFAPGSHVLHFENPRSAPGVLPADYTFPIVAGYTTILIVDMTAGSISESSQPCLTPGCEAG